MVFFTQIIVIYDNPIHFSYSQSFLIKINAFEKAFWFLTHHLRSSALMCVSVTHHTLLQQNSI